MNSTQFINMPSLLTGMSMGIDDIAAVFFMFYIVLWIVSLSYTYTCFKGGVVRKSFFAFFIAALSGSTSIIFSLDMISFYLFYSVMTFSAYGMIVHDRAQASRYAGRIYIVMAVVGESMLLAAMILAASSAGSTMFKDIAASAAMPNAGLVTGLVLVGFGIKAGIMPLHIWLPHAYTKSTSPASVVLSSAISNAGLIGLLKFLPFGSIYMPEYASICISLGILSAFFAVVIGLLQSSPKAVLAYSSISQMGLMFICIGIALGSPQLAAVAIPALVTFGLHHSLNKAALFMGEAVSVSARSSAARWLTTTLLIIPALSLAGMPFTSGGVFKYALKSLSDSYNGYASGMLAWIVVLTSVATAALMVRFVMLIIKRKPAEQSRGLLPIDMLGWIIFVVSAFIFTASFNTEIKIVKFLLGLWPVTAGTALFFILRKINIISKGKLKTSIYSSDMLEPIAVFIFQIAFMIKKKISSLPELKFYFRDKMLKDFRVKNILNHLVSAEYKLSLWKQAGIIFLLTAMLLYIVILI